MPSPRTRPSAADDPPAAATNVATAYPPSPPPPSTLARRLALVTLFGAALVLLVHNVDHPAANRVKAAVTSALSAAAPRAPVADSTAHLPAGDRLAVCFAGHVGTLASVFRQNLDAVRALDPRAAVFYHLDLYDDYFREGTDRSYRKEHEIGELQHVFDAARAAAVTTYSAADVRLPAQSACHRKPAATRAHYSHNFMQFYAAAGCYSMIKRAELDAGEQFKWILHLQPNMQIKVKFPPADAVPRVHLSGSAMALVPRNMADAYFSVVTAFKDGKCQPLDKMGSEPCKNYSYEEDSTECLLIKWLKLHDITPSNGVYVNRRIMYPEADTSE